MKNGEYELVIAPKEYPGKLYRQRYCYEHHLVWWQNTGETIQEGECLHHINGNKRDNTFSNLALMSESEHKKSHKMGALVAVLRCPSCGRIFERERRQTFLVLSSRLTFCSRACCGKTFYKGATPNIESLQERNLVRLYRK